MKTSTLLALLPVAIASPISLAPLLKARDAEILPDKYIVVLKNGGKTAGISSTSVIQSTISSIASDADHVYNHLGGFAATLSSDEVDKLRKDPNVKYIEHDTVAKIFATQTNAPWGLARLSNTKPGSTTYTYDEAGGEGVCAYVIDTGIDATHPDFEGRAEFIASFVPGVEVDDHGHGTHCAGTIGSKTFGVAKKSHLYGIKSFDKNGDGSTSVMIAGMDKVIEDAPSRDCPNGIVVSMSFGDVKTQSVNDAAAALVKAGYFAAAAAGNGDWLNRPVDAGDYSPASEPSICTVGASDSSDKVATFSNYGEVVDIYAPGVNVLSTKPGGGNQTMSGTSMATPHIAGLGAYFMSLGESATGLCEYLQSVALKDVVSGVPEGTKNLLAQNGLASNSTATLHRVR